MAGSPGLPGIPGIKGDSGPKGLQGEVLYGVEIVQIKSTVENNDMIELSLTHIITFRNDCFSAIISNAKSMVLIRFVHLLTCDINLPSIRFVWASWQTWR